jgi:hypothetical protein
MVLVVEAEHDAGWLAANAPRLRAAADEHGGVLVRGLRIGDSAAAATASHQLGAELMTEVEGFAPRTSLPDGVYSSAQWPADQPMCMHHELTSAPRHPRWLIFSCVSTGSEGGAISLADARKVLAALPTGVVEPFTRLGWQLVRSFGQLVGVSVADAFGTDDRAAVDEYCRVNGIDHEWTPDGGLLTRQALRAIAGHPVSGEPCWFNQIAFLNEWTMDPAVREFLVGEFGVDGLPFNTRYGDGTPLDPSVVEVINDVYEQHAEPVSWSDGDLLLVDNVGTAHSRAPYRGDREVVVALADPLPRG